MVNYRLTICRIMIFSINWFWKKYPIIYCLNWLSQRRTSSLFLLCSAPLPWFCYPNFSNFLLLGIIGQYSKAIRRCGELRQMVNVYYSQSNSQNQPFDSNPSEFFVVWSIHSTMYRSICFGSNSFKYIWCFYLNFEILKASPSF